MVNGVAEDITAKEYFILQTVALLRVNSDMVLPMVRANNTIKMASLFMKACLQIIFQAEMVEFTILMVRTMKVVSPMARQTV